jgi:hypothetical protein
MFVSKFVQLSSAEQINTVLKDVAEDSTVLCFDLE